LLDESASAIRFGQRAGHARVARGPACDSWPARVARALADSSDFGLLGSKDSPKMCDSLPWTPMNRRDKI